MTDVSPPPPSDFSRPILHEFGGRGAKFVRVEDYWALLQAFETAMEEVRRLRARPFPNCPPGGVDTWEGSDAAGRSPRAPDPLQVTGAAPPKK